MLAWRGLPRGKGWLGVAAGEALGALAQLAVRQLPMHTLRSSLPMHTLQPCPIARWTPPSASPSSRCGPSLHALLVVPWQWPSWPG